MWSVFRAVAKPPRIEEVYDVNGGWRRRHERLLLTPASAAQLREHGITMVRVHWRPARPLRHRLWRPRAHMREISLAGYLAAFASPAADD